MIPIGQIPIVRDTNQTASVPRKLGAVFLVALISEILQNVAVLQGFPSPHPKALVHQL